MIHLAKLTKTFVSATALGGVMALATVAGGAPGLADIAFAAEKDDLKYDERKTRRTLALSAKIYKVLGEAQEQADANNYPGAMEILEEGLGAKVEKLNS